MINLLENKIIKKIFKLQIVSILLLTAIIAKLSYSQILLHNKIENLASNMWNRSLPLEASRGNIIDKNNNIIVTNLPTLSIIIIPFQVENKLETSRKKGINT